jgi:hypothetical protein
MNVGIGDEAAQFLFWKYIKRIFGTVFSNCRPLDEKNRRCIIRSGNLAGNRLKEESETQPPLRHLNPV